jgi:hypothetical protein
LLVGVSDYLYNDGFKDLAGAKQDLQTMRALLVDRFGFVSSDIEVLEDRTATRDNILERFRQHLIAPAKPNSVVVFYFSGHGSQTEDELDGDETTDHLDETIVPHDSGRRDGHPNRDIIDDELNQLLGELNQRTELVTFILDSCHSGSGARGSATPRFIPYDPKEAKPPAARPRGIAEGAGNRAANARYVLLSGSRDAQLSNEGRINGVVQGSLTWALADTIRARGAKVTYRDVLEEVRERVARQFPNQTPQLEGTAIDRVVFGLESRPAQHYYLVSAGVSGSYEVRGGAVHGLLVGSELDVYATGASAGTHSSQGRLRLDSVGATSSRGRCVGRCSFEAGAHGFEIRRPAIASTVQVRIDPKLAQAATLAARLSRYPILTMTTSDEQWDLRLRAEGKLLLVERSDGGSASSGVALTDSTAVDVKVAETLAWAKWLAVSRIANTNDRVRIDLRIEGASSHAADAAQAAVFSVGDTFTVRARNGSNENLYFHLVAVNGDGEVSVLYPTPGAEEAVDAHSDWTRPLTATWNETFKGSEVRTQLKLFASTRPADLSFLEQPPFVVGDPRSAKGALESLAVVMATALGARNAPGAGVPMVDVDTWGTFDRSLITRPKPQAARKSE